jgi:N-carbamoylputrescine amidase
MRDLRIAIAAVQAPVGEVAANLERAWGWIRRARKEGADLVCFPELHITGYCNRPEMGGIAQEVPGPVTEDLTAMAKETGTVILAGTAEKNPLGGLPFASHVVIGPGGLRGVYRKLHLAPPERSTYGAGTEVPVFTAAGATFGIQLCYDAHFPELSTRMTEKGAEILFIPHASPRGEAEEKHQSWMRHLPARAFDNAVFVVACNLVGENCKGLHFPGNAVVIGPSGEVIACAVEGMEDLMVVDLKAADLDRVRKHEMRYFFPNRRPELYRRNAGS